MSTELTATSPSSRSRPRITVLMVGYAEEQGASLLRRFLPWLTSKHAIFVGGDQVALIKQRFRFFTKEFTVDTQPSALDPRFVLALALLALIAEARREDSN